MHLHASIAFGISYFFFPSHFLTECVLEYERSRNSFCLLLLPPFVFLHTSDVSEAIKSSSTEFHNATSASVLYQRVRDDIIQTMVKDLRLLRVTKSSSEKPEKATTKLVCRVAVWPLCAYTCCSSLHLREHNPAPPVPRNPCLIQLGAGSAQLTSSYLYWVCAQYKTPCLVH